jgi:hypothetical protein
LETGAPVVCPAPFDFTAFVLSVRSAGDVELGQGLRHFLFLVAQAKRDDWNNWNFGTPGTCGSLKSFERSG